MDKARIHCLPEDVINKIAAGEVIERPASVVKELVENAMDAGATCIDIQIEEGGKKKIRISDNVCGMGGEDVNLCYLRHTTSTLASADDLFHLRTNGFRGEAVASIAAVSHLTITTRTEADTEARWIKLSGGTADGTGKGSRAKGTEFLVEDLFFNTPVRKNFLGSDALEGSRILDIVTRLALAHPEIRRLVKGFQLHRRISGRPGNRTVGNHVDIRIFDRSRIIGAAAEQAERARRERRQRKGSGGIALYENVESVDSYPGVARSLRQINSSLYAAGARELNRIEFGLRGIRDGNFPGERFICA